MNKKFVSSASKCALDPKIVGIIFFCKLFGKPIVNKRTGEVILDKDGDVNYTGSPFISHFINLLLYAWLCMVIYLMLLQMFNPKKDQSNLKGYFIALAGALLEPCLQCCASEAVGSDEAP